MKLIYVYAACLALSFLVFSPSLNGEFIMDDWGYITQNATVTNAESPLKFWTTFETTDYWPLTYTLYWLEFKIFGPDPLGYHVVNVVLHSLNAFLVFVLATQFGLSWALFGALLFLLHPLHVQAVSWIAQSKTLLSTMFALLTLITYKDPKKFLLSVLFFTISLLAKTSALFLPFVILILEWTRSDRKLWRPAPFFLLALAGGLLTMYVNSINFNDTNYPIFKTAWYERLILVPQNLAFYLKSFVVPYPLAYLYTPPGPVVWAWLLTLVGCLCWIRNKFVAFYLLLLAPCLGFVTIPNMKLSLVSDHWAYLPDIFLCMFMAILLGKIQQEKVAKVVAAVALGISALLAFNHAKTFATEEDFWLQAVKVNPSSAPAYYNLGTSADKKNQIDKAVSAYERCVALDPYHARAFNNLGRGYFIQGKMPDARTSFERAVEANPKLIVAYLGLAQVHKVLAEKEKAAAVLKRGIELNPDSRELADALKSL